MFKGGIMTLFRRLFIMLLIMTLRINAGSLEESVSLGKQFEFNISRQSDGFMCSFEQEICSTYAVPVRMIISDLKLLRIENEVFREVGSFSVDPLYLESGNLECPACDTFYFRGKVGPDFDPALLLQSYSPTNGYQLSGNLKVMKKNGAGWVGISGMSFEQPLSSEMLQSFCQPVEASRITIELVPAMSEKE
jgi:hypothetical protein